MLHLKHLQMLCLIVSCEFTVNFDVAVYLHIFVYMCECVCISAFLGVCI